MVYEVASEWHRYGTPTKYDETITYRTLKCAVHRKDYTYRFCTPVDWIPLYPLDSSDVNTNDKMFQVEHRLIDNVIALNLTILLLNFYVCGQTLLFTNSQIWKWLIDLLLPKINSFDSLDLTVWRQQLRSSWKTSIQTQLNSTPCCNCHNE